MKTIEERAIEYAHQYRRDVHDLKGERADAAFAAYCQGAEDERKELTRWHDPKEPPESGLIVLVRRNTNSLIPYDLGHVDNDGSWVDSWCGSPIDDKILGWREIHE